MWSSLEHKSYLFVFYLSAVLCNTSLNLTLSCQIFLDVHRNDGVFKFLGVEYSREEPPTVRLWVFISYSFLK